MRVILVLVAIAIFCAGPASAQAPHLEHLPPAPDWQGLSVTLMLGDQEPWATPFEMFEGLDSPPYENTVRWLERLCDAAPELTLTSLGKSPQGRDIVAVIASREGATTAAEVAASERPCVLAHAGIHSGEIDGKDAGMMLLRDMTVMGLRNGELLDRVNFVFVPIFSVDGHERRSQTNRMNQRGPRMQGWRTTARNLNLNRDYAKADAVEMRHMLRALEEFDPELYLDLHVTDGADYEYDITYGYNGTHGWSPNIAGWLDEHYRPLVDRTLTEYGHVPGPLIFVVDRTDITKGMYSWTAGPRYSNGYGDARHVPTVLLENHSLKPYMQRVLGTYVFLEASLRAVADHADALRAAIAADRSARPSPLHLDYEVPDSGPLGTIEFRAIEAETYESEISGQTEVRWTGKPYRVEIPVIGNAERTRFVERPQAYWIPAEWADLGERLTLHGIAFERVETPTRVTAEFYRVPEAEIEDEPFEGHVRVRTGEVQPVTSTVVFPAGSLRVPTDQERGDLAMLLLEPQAPDSFFQWGFMLEVLQRTEYFESYVMEPMARAMMEEDPALAKEFEARLAEDEEFAANPRARLEFFYERTPYYDRAWKVYPIARER